MKNLILLYIFMFVSGITLAQSVTGPIKAITIGRQVWMLENLNVSTFNNGVVIPEAQDQDAWRTALYNHQPAWCFYDGDPKNASKYGKLYNFYAVIDSNGLCPQGWHVPSDAEWDTLFTYLGGKDVAIEKMKLKPVTKKVVEYYYEGGYHETIYVPCSNCYYWTAKQKENIPCNVCKNSRGKSYKGKYIPKTKHQIEHIEIIGGWDGTNTSGFTGLPGGARSYGGDFYGIGSNGYWWGSSFRPYSSDNAYKPWSCALFSSGGSSEYDRDLLNGMSVRCLRD